MIPHDIVRNPYLQFQWLPCVLVTPSGSQVLTADPFQLLYITGTRPVQFVSSKGDSNPHTVLLEVVPLTDSRPTSLAGVTAYNPHNIVFNGQTALEGWPDGNAKSSLAYGSCNISDMGVTICRYAGQNSGSYLDMTVGTNCWQHGGEVTNAAAVGDIYPRLFTFLGYTYKSIPQESVFEQGDTLGLVRINRHGPLAASIRMDDTAALDVGDVLEAGLAASTPGTSNWFYDLSTPGRIGILYDGYYDIHFGAECELGITTGPQTVALTLHNGTSYLDTELEFTVYPDTTYVDLQGYSSPYVSTHGLEHLTSGQELTVRYTSGPDDTTFKEAFLSVALHI